jgi:hypothetical protein
VKCTKCGADCRCLAGESAHPDNWFCPQCERIEALQAQVDAGYEAGWHALRQERDVLKAQLKAVRECARFSPYVECTGEAEMESEDSGDYFNRDDVLVAAQEAGE